MRYLVLQDGTVYEGEAIGASGDVIGEVVFDTSMVGCIETLNDVCYYGQIVAQTFPLIGNYGYVSTSGAPVLKGYVVRELCEYGSNFRKESELNDYLIKNGVVGISGIDTRSLTRKIRTNGVMNGIITDSLDDIETKLVAVKQYKISGAVNATAVKVSYGIGSNENRVALIDLGDASSVIDELTSRDVSVTVIPPENVDSVMNSNYKAVVISSGAGDPNELEYLFSHINEISKTYPTFAIGLGHQLLALSRGAKVYKLKYGHRGASQPVKNVQSGRVYVTASNVSFAVDESSLPDGAKVSYVNVNDNVVEGIEYSDGAYSVQFKVSTSDGPQSTGFLFDKLYGEIKGE